MLKLMRRSPIRGGQHISSDMLTKNQLGYVLMTPALLLIGAILLYPFFNTLWMSFRTVRLNMPQLGEPFVGLENYRELFASARFRNSMWLTGLFAVSFIVAQLVFGLAIALVINMEFRGRMAVRAAVLIPWAMALVITALLWRWMYNAVFGVVNYVLLYMRLLSTNVDFLGSASSAYFSVLVAEVWRNTPFMTIILLAGLQSIPKELYESARIDGAGRLACFAFITLPLLKYAMLVALLFRSIDAIRAFDLLYVLTQGGPGISTEIASLYSYKIMFQYMDFGRGSAATVIIAIFTTGLAILYLRVLRER